MFYTLSYPFLIPTPSSLIQSLSPPILNLSPSHPIFNPMLRHVISTKVFLFSPFPLWKFPYSPLTFLSLCFKFPFSLPPSQYTEVEWYSGLVYSNITSHFPTFNFLLPSHHQTYVPTQFGTKVSLIGTKMSQMGQKCLKWDQNVLNGTKVSQMEPKISSNGT